MDPTKPFFGRDPTTLSATNVEFSQMLNNDSQVGDQTLYQLEIENPGLMRAAKTDNISQ